MSAITQTPARVTSAGYDFNYAQWNPGTTVTLANVPWNSDYRDIVRFQNQNALDTYISKNAGPTIEFTKMAPVRVGRPIRVDAPFTDVFEFNYLRAANPMSPAGDDARTYYYFITDVVPAAPNTTEIYVQLDVWQTFGFSVQFGNCYIERGHVGIANENQFSDNGREYLTIPEGLDIGGEYQIVDQWKRDIASARGNDNFSILVTSTVSLTDDPGTVESPKLVSAKGSTFENLPSGAENYVFADVDHFMNFMEAFSDRPWVTQGISNITAIPDFGDYGINAVSTVIEGVAVYKVGNGSMRTKKTVMKANWRNELLDFLPRRYWNLKKFFTFPYLVLEMTSYTGTPLVIKPESWSDSHATVVEVPHFAQPGARLVFYPYRYNAAQPGPDPTTDAYGVFNDGGEFFDMMTGIFNFPTFALVNNGYLNYMASNAHGIAYQHSSAEWSQQKALQGNQNSYDQVTAGMELSKGLNQLGINAATAQADISNLADVYRGVQSTVGGAAGGPGGLIAAGANAAMGATVSIGQRNAALAVSNNASATGNRMQNDTAAYMRDTNKSLADFAAKGDYQNQIAGIGARVQDARLTQPTTSGQMGGDAFNLAAYKWGYDIKVKMLQNAAMTVIGEYWLRYGYAVNRFGRMPSNFQVMDRFTYWKLKETYITGSRCPESFKQIIRGIFEKGVTVWANPADIGFVDMGENYPLPGVRL